MLNIVIDWKKEELQFAGKTITAEMRPLKRWAMMLMKPNLEGSVEKLPGETFDQYQKRLTPEQRREAEARTDALLSNSPEIFKDHVRNIQGISINGKPVKPEELPQENIFFSLCMAIIIRLLDITRADKQIEGNFDALSDTIESDSANHQ